MCKGNKTMTSDEISNSHPLIPTTDPDSEIRLAKAMGYPSSWHVVRIVPHPASPDIKSCMDLIYTGDPSKNVDLYYNHNAAFAAALFFKEGVSTGYEGKGGQMLARKAIFKKGEEVEVEFDGAWYDATIVKVKMYDDDVRYTVHYTEEDSTQTNVSEDTIRKPTGAATAAKGKKKSTTKQQKLHKKEIIKEEAPEESPAKASQQKVKEDEEEALALAEKMGLPPGWTSRPRPNHRYYIKSADGKHTFRSRKQALTFLEQNPEYNQERNPEHNHPSEIPSSEPHEDHTKDDDMSEASSAASSKDHHEDNTADNDQNENDHKENDHKDNSLQESSSSDSSTTPPTDNLAASWGLPPGWIVRARSKHRYSIRSPDGTKYCSKRKALESVGIDSAPSPKKKRKRSDGAPPAQVKTFRHVKEDEGDPPWRRDGHRYLHRTVMYNTGDDVQKGVVTGWLDATDRDSAGQPAYVSERSGMPALLFHVNFQMGDVVFVDLEEWELKKCLMPIEGETGEEEEEGSEGEEDEGAKGDND